MSNRITLAPSHDDFLLAFLIDQRSLTLLVFTFGGMLLLMVLEQLWPRRHSADVPVAHWLTNWFLASLNFFVMFWLTLQLGSWALLRSYFPDPGLYERLQPAVAVVIIVVLVEFAQYWIHRVFHRVSGLWRMHAVHHTDTTFDVTTSHRHHIAEVVIGTLVLLPVFLLFGAPTLMLVLYQLLRVLLVLFNHSNIYVPAAVDRVLRKVIVTPDFHRLHHSLDLQFTNSNYGTVVPWFDYLFGTARSVPFEDAGIMPVGLEYLRKSRDSRPDRLLLLPLMWRRWVLPVRNPINSNQR
ncbi:MAG: sterol desaturase/sphingolipid hydroxylase (fatty acid hydroxylase superfamily) [Halieaceae bacterium]